MYAIVFPPSGKYMGQNKRGFRHAVFAGAERTLCGRGCDDWFTEVESFHPSMITCKSCRRVTNNPLTCSRPLPPIPLRQNRKDRRRKAALARKTSR